MSDPRAVQAFHNSQSECNHYEETLYEWMLALGFSDAEMDAIEVGDLDEIFQDVRHRKADEACAAFEKAVRERVKYNAELVEKFTKTRAAKAAKKSAEPT